jgi:hypothetical protein
MKSCLNHVQAIQLIDKGPFRRLLAYARPSLAEKDIPHRTKLRKEILDRADAVQDRVRIKLQVTSNSLIHSNLKLMTATEYSWTSVDNF